MAGASSDPEDAITQDEIQGTAPAPKAPRNAFTELMTRKRKPEPAVENPKASRGRSYKARDGLGVYIDNPASHPPSRVIYHNDDFVAINDLYPKASVHTLLLPRSPAHNLLHPFEAFDDAEFLASVQAEVLKLKELVAKELQRRFGKDSKAEAAREAVLNGVVEPEGDELPKGRDWQAEVITGVHAHPSMNHLHVHVLSRDMYSDCLKHRKHYNSFNTPFLIDVADFPLPPDHPGRAGDLLKRDFTCWRCGQNFGNQFARLKEHLAVEFAEWKKE
ncbi:Aprataxin-like protein [Colletotrichum siamense]|uniref:Aprataxin-like protein n=1 Tax=Colletotrichum siamense TaxID=690259 RepID=A0A9P5EY26_COLSI|nr:Aprataxin-like protein [Colletotrichum siamense]XP_037181698.1 Aprataxin-like protein [Colletotrichum aenigma]KAF4848977.1 Aprataxin-like protein [Colletotrichum siamense]KAF4861557.1 Aprataxin-like protein [Colletotrichum siamense]KAF4876133.1 Aprataxin-like protein [Colletotrichum siamense]KAF5505165.1 Aprataxin-like protein [Colletotrichum siamense]KAF5524059.1 Aprataxin-like protein [Colletotrichum aenigma]